ncbi:MAG: hypothetical protein JO352_00715, partial [Chloroflexi bacterium]|nr:hypothetical protein [Chloroflexota bacterium]
MRRFGEASAARAGIVALGLLSAIIVLPAVPGGPQKTVAAPAPFHDARHPTPELLAALDHGAGWAVGMMRARIGLDIRQGRRAIGMDGNLA